MASAIYQSFRSTANPRLGYVPALDGLRAFAIIAVMLSHFESNKLFPAGGIGVDLFFVLSGFLITTLLLQEWGARGDISLKRFYQRRALRLLPALALFVLTYVAINSAFRAHDFTIQQPPGFLLRNAGIVAIYGLNWLVAFGGYAGAGFTHLWSLSVEEQFYLLWPAILLVLLKARLPAPAIMTLTLSIAVVSALTPHFLEGDWHRFYYGTDFRLQGLLLGSLVAQLYVSGVIRESTTQSLLFKSALLATVFYLGSVVPFVSGLDYFLLRGGYTIVAICSCVLVVAAAVSQRSFLTGLLSQPMLVYVGQRSYALYLWHNAIGFWLRSLDPLPQVALGFLLSFIAAEVSYRLVEAPALRLKSRLGRPQAEAPTSPAVPSPGVAA
jgi:peptidoglycan/LPS O-acetylase OafA/YrhL